MRIEVEKLHHDKMELTQNFKRMSDGDGILRVCLDLAGVAAPVLRGHVLNLKVGPPEEDPVGSTDHHLAGRQHAGALLPEQDHGAEVLDPGQGQQPRYKSGLTKKHTFYSNRNA